MTKTRYRVRTDGASRGNPGPSAIGVSVLDASGNEIATASESIGIATNNVAEYRALIRAVEMMVELRAQEVEFLLDSELIVKQMNGDYRVRNPKMQDLHAEATRGLGRISKTTLRHIPREENHRADALANQALDHRSRSPRNR